MADPLYINGRFTTTAERVIGAEDRGFQFADGVYEVLKFQQRRPLFVDIHYRRLERSLLALEIPCPWSRETFESVSLELLARAELEAGLLYFQVTRGDCERAHQFSEGLTPTALAYPRALTFPDAAKKEGGIRVITTEDLRGRLCHIKSTNLLPAVLANRAASRGGAAEALFVGDGAIREGARSSFFAVIDETVITHPLGERILPGTVRELTVQLARSVAVRLVERPPLTSELARFTEAFITSTSQGVMPVVAIDGTEVGSGRRGPLTLLLQRAFDDLEGRQPGA